MTLNTPLSTARWLGIIGSVLTLFLYVPGFGGILNLIGALLILGAVKSISTHTRSRHIFILFIVYILALIASSILTIALGGYIIGRIDAGQVTTGIKLIEAFITILPAIAIFFFMRSYRAIAKTTEVRLFSVTGTAAFVISLIIALTGILFTFTEGAKILAQLSTVVSVLGYVAVPVLGIISYVLLRPKTLEYRFNS